MKNIAIFLPRPEFNDLKIVTHYECNPIYFFISSGLANNIERFRGLHFIAIIFHPDISLEDRSDYLNVMQYRIR